MPPLQPRTPPVALSGLVELAAAARSEQNHDGERAEACVDDSAAECGHAVEPAVVSLGAVAERCVQEAPQRVPGEPDRQEDQQHLPERLVGDRLQRPLWSVVFPPAPKTSLIASTPMIA